MKSWRQTGGALLLELKDLSVKTLSTLWLLDSQHANWHAQTQQKIKPASDLPLQAPRVAKCELLSGSTDTLLVEWADNAFPPSQVDLLSSAPVCSNRHGLAAKQPWSKFEGDNAFPTSSFTTTTSSQSLLTNLARFGVHLVTDMPHTSQGTEAFIRQHLGPPRETLYGGMWDTAPRQDNVNDTAYTYDALDPHTDCCYLIDSPGLQCFNCVAQDQSGGGFTRLVDSAHVLLQLQRDYPETYQYFSTRQFAFHHTETGLNALHYAPVIQTQGTEVVQFRYNEYDLAKLGNHHVAWENRVYGLSQSDWMLCGRGRLDDAC
ncbi:hypothetical protein BASA81_008587 [Batrachochytrium salamandrivorans]|nr:hypothetical protein BASA81_008587 [Batrachochytrium salamandrivorans]